jgi:hypothetical protein
MYDLVHLGVQGGVFVSEVFCQVLLVDSASGQESTKIMRACLADISCVVWYAQKLNALPAHSMITFGLRPLNTLVL